MSKYKKRKPISEETRKKMSEARKGKPNGMLGKRHSEETKEKIRLSNLGKQDGEKGHNWKGGTTPEYKLGRRSSEYRLWRKKIFERDNYTCQKTGEKENLVTHHIYNFYANPELRYEISNGITLSKKAHDKFHSIYGIRNNTREQLDEYLNNNNASQ